METIAIRQRLGLPEDAPDTDLAGALQEVLGYLTSLDRPDCGVMLSGASSPADVLDAVLLSSDSRLVGYRQSMMTMQRETEAMRAQVARAHSRDVVNMQAEKGYAIPRPIIETLIELHMHKPAEALAIMQCLPNLKVGSLVKARVAHVPAPELLGE